jgi:hypothetical protein
MQYKNNNRQQHDAPRWSVAAARTYRSLPAARSAATQGAAACAFVFSVGRPCQADNGEVPLAAGFPGLEYLVLGTVQKYPGAVSCPGAPRQRTVEWLSGLCYSARRSTCCRISQGMGERGTHYLSGVNRTSSGW